MTNLKINLTYPGLLGWGKCWIRNFLKSCGERGIRTPGTIAGTTVFETAPINHSGISPGH